MDRPPSDQDPTCLICSKPIRWEVSTLSEQGELIHTRCRTQELQLRALERVDRAQAGQKRAADLLADVKRRQSVRQATATPSPPPPGTTGFTLAGRVTSWDPWTRELWLGDSRFSVPRAVTVPALTPGTSITVAGHHWNDSGPWVVTEVRVSLADR